MVSQQPETSFFPYPLCKRKEDLTSLSLTLTLKANNVPKALLYSGAAGIQGGGGHLLYDDAQTRFSILYKKIFQHVPLLLFINRNNRSSFGGRA